MNPPNYRPTEMSFGWSHQREEILSREAHHSRVARRVRTIARVVLALLVVVVVAAIVVGPGRAIDWVDTYLFPMAALLAVGLCVLLLLVRLTNRLPGGHDLSDWWQ